MVCNESISWPAAMITEKYVPGEPDFDRVLSYIEPGLKKMFEAYDVDDEFNEDVFYSEGGVVQIFLRKDVNAVKSSVK